MRYLIAHKLEYRNILRGMVLLCPCGLLVALVLWIGALGAERGASGGSGFLAAGFGRMTPDVAGREGVRLAGRVSRLEAEEEGRRQLAIRLPSLDRQSAPAKAPNEITVSKGSGTYKVDFGAKRRKWNYLSRALRVEIDRAVIERGRWKIVVVHNSATERGNAKVFDYYHRQVKGMRDGLAYHFVIGNGSYSGDGEIEIGQRWNEQLAGGRVDDDGWNREAIGVCLVGNFEKEKVSGAQLEALDELIDYLEAKAGSLRLATHRQLDGTLTSCPGRFFPEYVLLED